MEHEDIDLGIIIRPVATWDRLRRREKTQYVGASFLNEVSIRFRMTVFFYFDGAN